MTDLRGTSALVTGGASGIGRATASLLADLGASVTTVGRSEPDAPLPAVRHVRADVLDTAALAEAVRSAREAAPLRWVVHAAGTWTGRRTLGRHGPHDLDEFAAVVRTNLVGTFNLVRLAAAAMGGNDTQGEDGARGAVVTISSIGAFDGQVGQAAYAASKAGVVAMTLPLARELAVFGIRLCSVAPGTVDTPLLGGTGDEVSERLVDAVVFPRRVGRPAEVASLVVEALTNPYLNGSVIRVDGALRMPPA